MIKNPQRNTDNRKKIFYLNADFLGSIDSNKTKTLKKDQTKLLIDEFIEKGEVEYVILDEALLAEGIQEDPVDIALNEVFYVVISEHNSITAEILDGDMEEYEEQLFDELNASIKDWGLRAKRFKLLSIVPRKK